MRIVLGIILFLSTPLDGDAIRNFYDIPMTPNETWESDNSQNTLIASENCSAATSASSCRAHEQIGYSSDHSPRCLHRVAEGSAYRRQGWRDMRELSQQSLEERFAHAHTAEGNRHTRDRVHQGHDR